MSLTELLVPTYRNLLRTLSGLLNKAVAQRGDAADALLAARLQPDMYPLAAQLRFVALQAQEAFFRLRGEPLPDTLAQLGAEGRNAGEAPGTIADARARIDAALAFLDTVDAARIDAAADTALAITLPNGMTFDMTGETYARDWALPQVYFHAVAAYAILRAQGVEIGKADYVPHMFAYLRQDAPVAA